MSSVNMAQDPGFSINEALENQSFFIPLKNLSLLAETSSTTISVMEGLQHGAENSSVLVTDIAPGEGSPLHLHHTEEIQVLAECRAEYLIGNERFLVEGPGIVKIPANTPYTFINMGEKPIHIVTFFHQQH